MIRRGVRRRVGVTGGSRTLNARYVVASARRGVVLTCALLAASAGSALAATPRHILFHGTTSGDFAVSGLFEANADGTDPLAVPAGGYTGGSATLSPDGRFIVYSESCAIISSVRHAATSHFMHATTAQRRAYTRRERAALRKQADWSRALSHAHSRRSSHLVASCPSEEGLYVDDIMDPTGAHQHLVIADGQSGDWFYDWSSTTDLGYSPDGAKVAVMVFRFNSNPDSPEYGTFESALATVNVDGSGFTILASGLINPRGVSFSPDGSKLVYSSEDPDAGTYALYTINSDGTNATELIDPETLCCVLYPVFSPDGQTIAGVQDVAGPTGNETSNVWAINSDGSAPRQITIR
jgi:WD40 repeat protein